MSEEPKLTNSDSPCQVKGYDLSSGEYAALIQYHVNQGHFFLAAHFFDLAKRSCALERIEVAARETFNSQPM